jgi:hypothetical protein
MAITKNSVILVRDELAKALKVLESFGFNASIDGSIQYSDSSISLKINVVELVKTEDGDSLSPDAINYLNKCSVFGLEKELLGKEFIFNGQKYKLIGLLSNSRKYPILCECNGKCYKLPVASVVAGFNVDSKSEKKLDSAPLFLKKQIGGFELFKKIKFDINNAEHVNSIALTMANYLSPEILTADGERGLIEQRKLLKDVLDSLAYLSKVTGIKLNPKELNLDY